MSEFLLLFRGGEGDELRKSPEAWQKHMERWGTWMGELSEQGKMMGAQPLAASGQVVSGQNKIVTDGPFMEGKEMVGGYLMCKAANYDEAMEISKGCPILEFENGIVEVREIQKLEM